MGENRGPEGSGIAGRRLVAAPFQPGEKFDVGRAHAGPKQLDLLRVFVAERSGRGLRELCRDADPQTTGHELEKRPAAGLVELIEPACKLRGRFRFAEGGQRVTTEDNNSSSWPCEPSACFLSSGRAQAEGEVSRGGGDVPFVCEPSAPKRRGNRASTRS